VKLEVKIYFESKTISEHHYGRSEVISAKKLGKYLATDSSIRVDQA